MKHRFSFLAPGLIIFLAISLVVSLSTTARAADQTPPVAQQIGPGKTSAINHGTTAPAGDKPHKILNGALTPQTRETLQKAMNSAPAK